MRRSDPERTRRSSSSDPKRTRRPRTLDRALSHAGLCSRTQAAALVRAGRVRVNGTTARDPDAWVDLERDRIEVDGERLVDRELVYLALHKPKGYVTTRSDERGRRTIYALLGDFGAWIAPVGRLDRDTSGLLLLTNDTQFAARVTEPSSNVEKRYRVDARGELSDDALERLRRGVELDDGPTAPAKVRLIRRTARETRLELAIREGRNRQVRRMIAAVGSKVLALKRISIGRAELGELPIGAFRALSAVELGALGVRPSNRRR